MSQKTNTTNASAAMTAQGHRTNREAHEAAAGMNLEDAFFVRNGINPTDSPNCLAQIIARSQDGNPIKQIREEMSDGRLVGVTDNLNRLLADVLNNASESGDLDTLASDLNYAADQLRAAHQHLLANTYRPFGRKDSGVAQGKLTLLP